MSSLIIMTLVYLSAPLLSAVGMLGISLWRPCCNLQASLSKCGKPLAPSPASFLGHFWGSGVLAGDSPAVAPCSFAIGPGLQRWALLLGGGGLWPGRAEVGSMPGLQQQCHSATCFTSSLFKMLIFPHLHLLS